MSWEKPVFDRTKKEAEYAGRLNAKGDYDYLNDYICYLGEEMAGDNAAPSSNREILDWDAGLKGVLKRSDLERITGNIKVLEEELKLTGEMKEISDTPSESFFRDILEKVSVIRENFSTRETPPVPEEPLNTAQKWNDIEKILSDAYDWIQNRYFPRCGTDTYCGESGLLL